MKGWKKIALGAFLVVVLALAGFIVPTVWGKPWSIDHFYAELLRLLDLLAEL